MKTWATTAAAWLLLIACVFVPHFSQQPMPIDVAMGAGEPRSPEWPKVRAKHLRTHPVCEACGGKKDLQVHHVTPFHVDPKLELDQSNLITLCGPGHRNHHLDIGHGGSFTCRNPNVREDAERFRKMRECKICD